MKIKSVLFIFLCACLLSFTGGKKKKSLYPDAFKGNVKMATKYFYKGVVKMGLPAKDSLKTITKYTFDSKGNKTEESSYKADGSLIYKWTYSYDEHGHQTSQTTQNKRGISTTKYSYKLDDSGRIKEQYIMRTNGNITSRNVRKYDDNGNQIEVDNYDSSGNSTGKSTSVYDDAGNLTVQTSYTTSGIQNMRNIYSEFDASGNYGDEQFKSSFWNYHYKYKYDSNGGKTEQKCFNKDGSITTFIDQSEYDKAGNWIERISYKDGKIDAYMEQKIEYY